MKIKSMKEVGSVFRKITLGVFVMMLPILASCDSSNNGNSGGGSSSSNVVTNWERLEVGAPTTTDGEGISYDSATSAFYMAISSEDWNANFTGACTGFFGDSFGNYIPFNETIDRDDIIVVESVDSDGFAVYDVTFPPIIRTGDGFNTPLGTYSIVVKLRFGFVDDANNLKIDPPSAAGTYDVDYYDIEITCDGEDVDNFESEDGDDGEGIYEFS